MIVGVLRVFANTAGSKTGQRDAGKCVVKYLPVIFRVMALIITGGVACTQTNAQANDNGRNSIKETQVLIPGINLLSRLDTLTVEQKNVSISYFDGLGRAVQTVSWKNSPGMNDIVQPIVYDAYGRESVRYLPYTSLESSGVYKVNPVGTSNTYGSSAHHDFYTAIGDEVADDEQPYARTVFEASPLNRVLKQGASGEAWQPNAAQAQDKSIKKEYGFNGVSEVIRFDYDETTARLTFAANGSLKYYAPNQLYANKTIDEHNNEVIEYADKEGKTILKKVQYKEENGVKSYAKTYYIYDDFGNLVMVLPPEATEAINISLAE